MFELLALYARAGRTVQISDILCTFSLSQNPVPSRLNNKTGDEHDKETISKNRLLPSMDGLSAAIS